MGDITTRIRIPLLAAMAALLVGGGPAPAVHADDTRAGADRGDRNEERAERRYDYSRFSDGPRRVPRARGNSLERAQALGLGKRRTATRLLAGRPLTSWIEAARGDAADSLHWPVDDGRFGRGFGYTRRRRTDLRHDGIDIVAPEGTVVRSVADGIVAYSDNGIRGFGNCVIIVHPDGKVSLYAHNYRNTVQPGWRVTKGERIGFVGSTGISRGPHLHFELRDNGRLIDPAHLFDRSTIRRGRAESRESRREESSPAEAAASREPADDPPVARAEEAQGAIELAPILAGDAPESLRERSGRLFRNLLWPVRGGAVERGFESRHRAVDIAAPRGTAVRAAADGLVVHVGEGIDGLGRSIVLLHRNGWVTVYGSNAKVEVREGQTVRRGEWIGEVGASGASEGSHLHFELRDAGELRDPAPLLVQVPAG